jgi:hypothetical protein
MANGPRELPTASKTDVLVNTDEVAVAQGETGGRKAASNNLIALISLLATRICPWFVGLQPPPRSNMFHQ